jgi:tripartite-type tricarboxylate transporter receptor subunit TctC
MQHGQPAHVRRVRTVLNTAAILAGGIAAVFSAPQAQAQAWPTHTVTILVGFPPGGPLDWMARVVQPKLSEKWGQSVVVENKPGAGGLIAVQQVQKAPPDGTVLTPHTQQMALLPLFMKQADVEPGRNLQPLGSVFFTPYLIVTSGALGPKTLRDFIAYAKANPGKLNNSLATNTGQYLDGIGFAKAAGLQLAPIGYGGGAGVLGAVASNEAQLALTTGGTAGFIAAGKMVPLAVTSAARVSQFPNVPTVKEAAGFDYVSTVDFGYYTTQGTPAAVVEKETRDIAQAMDSEDIKEAIRKQGFEPAIQSADQWLAKMQTELRRAKELAAAAGITPQ